MAMRDEADRVSEVQKLAKEEAEQAMREEEEARIQAEIQAKDAETERLVEWAARK